MYIIRCCYDVITIQRHSQTWINGSPASLLNRWEMIVGLGPSFANTYVFRNHWIVPVLSSIIPCGILVKPLRIPSALLKWYHIRYTLQYDPSIPVFCWQTACSPKNLLQDLHSVDLSHITPLKAHLVWQALLKALQDGVPKIAKLVYKWLNYGLW